jgi:hypothetical protein
MALASKKLVAETAVLLSPNAKPSHILPPKTSKMVKQFHTADAICKIVPGTICYNLQEAYSKFYGKESCDISRVYKVFQSYSQRNVLATVGGIHAGSI